MRIQAIMRKSERNYVQMEKKKKKKWSNFFPSLLGKSATCLFFSLFFVKERETNFNNFNLYIKKSEENIFVVAIN